MISPIFLSLLSRTRSSYGHVIHPIKSDIRGMSYFDVPNPVLVNPDKSYFKATKFLVGTCM